MKYIDHLRELRNRLLISFFFLIITFFFFFLNVDFVGKILTKPLFSLLDESANKRMIFTALPEIFLSNLKISLFASFLISVPFFIIQVFLFASPALYRNEKKIIIPIISLTPILFFGGVLFAYYFLIPVIWSFFLSFENFMDSPFPIELESKYSEYMKLTMYLLFASGLSFQFPILIIFFTKIGIFDHNFLRINRKFFYIGILVFSALFTPPDVISQIGIAIPLIIFYESSIIFIKYFLKE